jgi:transcriptional regulator with XRE-family HTH domain
VPPKKHRLDPKAFGARLREHRTAAGLTQRQLAERVGMAYQNVARLERGAHGPSWERVVELAAALGKTPNDFLGAPGGGDAT